MCSGIGRLLPVMALALAAACGGEAANEQSAAAVAGGEAAAPAPHRAVVITSPTDGAIVDGPSVRVLMEAHGLTVVPAGDSTPNSGHLHLFLDRDLSPAEIPIPTEPGFIVHMGTGASEYTFDTVAPGEHRLIAVVGDALHIPVRPWLVDTVRFTVR